MRRKIISIKFKRQADYYTARAVLRFIRLFSSITVSRAYTREIAPEEPLKLRAHISLYLSFLPIKRAFIVRDLRSLIKLRKKKKNSFIAIIPRRIYKANRACYDKVIRSDRVYIIYYKAKDWTFQSASIPRRIYGEATRDKQPPRGRVFL